MRTIVVAVFVVACAGSASAQALKLEFNQGKVSIDAAGVPVGTILAEWARLGGTKVVGAERIAGSPLTIHLEDVPEAQALEIVLRNVAGYMAAPRQAASLGASAYDRILVMPTSTAPQATAAAGNRTPGPAASGTNPAQRNGRAPFGGGANQNPAADLVAVPAADEPDADVNEPAFQFPQQNPFQPGQTAPAVQPGTPFGQPTAFGTPMPQGGPQPAVMSFGQPPNQGVSVNPTPEQPAPMLQFPGMPAPSGATGGFGVVGSPTPGVILQPPQPAQPGQPVRPPGGD